MSRTSATYRPALSADPALVVALLAELAAAPDGVSLPRLCKRLDVRMSVLLRTLAWIGEGDAGGVRGAGWVRTAEDGARTLAVLTEAGRAARIVMSSAAANPGGSAT